MKFIGVNVFIRTELGNTEVINIDRRGEIFAPVLIVAQDSVLTSINPTKKIVGA